MMRAYTPLDLAADVGDSAAVILPWVGAAVGFGVAILLLTIGLQAAVEYFRDVVQTERNLAATREDWAAWEAAGRPEESDDHGYSR